MPDGRKKVFISWSKAQSKEVALALTEFLPKILDGVDLFMSDKDIDPGERSMKVIEGQLDGTSYGLLVVTSENQSEPWLNFEAGALSKYVGKDADDQPRVVPILVDIAKPSQLTGPISQFQAVKLDRAGIERIILAIASLNGSDAGTITQRLNWAWSEFDAALERAKSTGEPSQKTDERPIEDRVDEALEILRSLQRTIPDLASEFTRVSSRGAVTVRRRSSDNLNSRRLTLQVLEELVSRSGGKLHRTMMDEKGSIRQIVVSPVDEFEIEELRTLLNRHFGNGHSSDIHIIVRENDDAVGLLEVTVRNEDDEK